MLVQITGAFGLRGMAVVYAIVYENLDEIKCEICGQVFQPGQMVGSAQVRGLEPLDHHVKCAQAVSDELRRSDRARGGERASVRAAGRP